MALNKPSATERYEALRAEAIAKTEALLAKLQAGETGIHWGHVGSMAEVVELVDQAIPHA